MFNEDDTEAVLMVHASNAFNSINRETYLHNTKDYVRLQPRLFNNCTAIPSDLFVHGGKLLKSLETTTKGDPAALAIYGLGTTPLLAWLSNLPKEKTEKFPSK